MNYDEIIKASRAYADRNDIEVEENMDVFVLMVEARANRLLKTREQSTRAFTPTIENEEYYSLPPDYAGMRDVQINSAVPTAQHSTTPYSYLNPELFNAKRNQAANGENYYTIIANQLQIWPCQPAGRAIEMVYYQKIPNLNSTDVGQENWASISHPDIYISGMVAEIETFAKNYEAASVWYAKMESIISELDVSDEEERWAGSALVMRIAE